MIPKRALQSCCRFVVCALAALLAQSVFGQGQTTSAIRGEIVDASGVGIPGVTIQVTNVPTNSVYDTTTNNNGRFNLGGLRVGGPYTIAASASGFRTAVETGIFLELGEAYRATLRMEDAGDVIELDAFEVVAGPTTVFDSNSFGTGSSVDSVSVQLIPSINENVADIVRLNPLVNILDPERLEINAAGQHHRQNSVQVDGVNLNDQFGLEPSGFPSLLNPFPIRTIEQFQISVSPYDVRNSGFTGASINAVTKSGTNKYEGEVYYFYSDDSLRGDNFFTGESPEYESSTYGVSLGGPILKDRLFFFANYERAEIIEGASNPGFIPDPVELQRLRDYLLNLSTNAYPNGYDPGTFGAASAATLEDEKFLAKINWRISDAHELVVRYSQTEGMEPQFGDYSDSGETALTSAYFTNEFKNTAIAGQLNSRWSDRLETEFVIARDTFDKVPTYNNPVLFPEIIIDLFPGTSADGSRSVLGELFFGSEDSRQANSLATETLKGKGIATIYLGAHTITAGFDYEETEFDNLFLQDVYGNIEFNRLSDLLNDAVILDVNVDGSSTRFNQAFMNRNAGVQGREIAAQSDYTDLGLFIQNQWQVNNQLELLFGIRYDLFSTDASPAANEDFNSSFVTEDGRTFDNTNTIDGTETFALRAAFSYDFDTERKQQIRGGLGLFQGRVPGVYMSNAFSNNGATTSAINYVDGIYANRGINANGDPFGGITLTEFLNNEFDPANPIVFVETPRGSQVDLIDPDFELPAVWRANLAYDVEITNGWIFTVEALQTITDKGVYVENVNLKADETNPVAPDGRIYFSDDEQDGRFGNVFNLRNTSKGEAFNLSFQLARAMRDNWSANVSYTYGDSTDVSSVTSSTASSNYGNRAIFNGNEDVEATSNYQTQHRILINGAYQHEWTSKIRSKFSFVFERRSGRPFSYTFGSDVNNDGLSFNDLFYVPTGVDDPNISFAANTTAEQISDFFAYIQSQDGLAQYAGGAVDRNTGQSRWVSRLDIRLAQEFDLRNNLRLELWISCQNFLNLLNDEWGQSIEVPFSYTVQVADAEFITDPAAANFNTYELELVGPDSQQLDVDRNYAISVGAALKF